MKVTTHRVCQRIPVLQAFPIASPVPSYSLSTERWWTDRPQSHRGSGSIHRPFSGGTPGGRRRCDGPTEAVVDGELDSKKSAGRTQQSDRQELGLGRGGLSDLGAGRALPRLEE